MQCVQSIGDISTRASLLTSSLPEAIANRSDRVVFHPVGVLPSGPGFMNFHVDTNRMGSWRCGETSRRKLFIPCSSATFIHLTHTFRPSGSFIFRLPHQPAYPSTPAQWCTVRVIFSHLIGSFNRPAASSAYTPKRESSLLQGGMVRGPFTSTRLIDRLYPPPGCCAYRCC